MNPILRRIWPSPEVLRDRAPVVAPILLVGVISVASVVAMRPLVRSAFAGRPELLPLVSYGIWALAVLSPFLTLLKGLVLGGVAWAVLVLSGVEARYRGVVSTLAYAQSILALQGAWVVMLLWMRGRSAVGAPVDLVSPTGLDALVADPASPLAALARGVSPFHLLWMVFLAVGFAAVGGVSWRRTSAAALAVWLLAVGVGVVRAWL